MSASAQLAISFAAVVGGMGSSLGLGLSVGFAIVAVEVLLGAGENVVFVIGTAKVLLVKVLIAQIAIKLVAVGMVAFAVGQAAAGEVAAGEVAVRMAAVVEVVAIVVGDNLVLGMLGLIEIRFEVFEAAAKHSLAIFTV